MTRRRPGWRRWLMLGVGVVTLLTLGAATTIAAAWTCALRSVTTTSWGPLPAGRADRHGISWSCRGRQGPHYIEACLSYPIVLNSPVQRPVEFLPPPPNEWARAHLPSWARVPVRPANCQPILVLLTSAGFPMIACHGAGVNEIDFTRGDVVWRYPVAEGVLPGPLVRGSGLRTGLPFQPVWPGFYVDTLIYAGLWLAPVALGRRLSRSGRRIRRGRCPMCGYDVRGDYATRCPECGWAAAMVRAPRRGVRARTLVPVAVGCLLGGAALAIGVSCAGAWYGFITNGPRRPWRTVERWVWRSESGPACTAESIGITYGRMGELWTYAPDTGYQYPPFPGRESLGVAPWAIIPRAGRWESAEFFAAGWPALCCTATRIWCRPVMGDARQQATPTLVTPGVILNSGPVQPMGWNDRCDILPLTPIWRGLLVDTAFYAGILFVLLQLLRLGSRVLWPTPNASHFAGPHADQAARPA